MFNRDGWNNERDGVDWRGQFNSRLVSSTDIAKPFIHGLELLGPPPRNPLHLSPPMPLRGLRSVCQQSGTGTSTATVHLYCNEIHGPFRLCHPANTRARDTDQCSSLVSPVHPLIRPPPLPPPRLSLSSLLLHATQRGPPPPPLPPPPFPVHLSVPPAWLPPIQHSPDQLSRRPATLAIDRGVPQSGGIVFSSTCAVPGS